MLRKTDPEPTRSPGSAVKSGEPGRFGDDIMRQPGSRLNRWHPLVAILAVAVATGHAAPALAWNKAGHMVSGAIGYAVLKQDSPRALAGVIALLKAHPAYKEKWEPLIQRP